MIRALAITALLFTVSAHAKTVDNFMGCKWVIPGYYKEAAEMNALHHFRNFKKDKSLQLISFYELDLLSKKYAAHEYLKLVYSNSVNDIRINSYQLNDETVGFGKAHIEFVLNKGEQTLVLVTDDFDDAAKILSRCVDESALNEHLSRLTIVN